jgi:hypothetical protein
VYERPGQSYVAGSLLFDEASETSLARLRATLGDIGSTLVMKGSPVRVRASALLIWPGLSFDNE